jgi:radical SAM superfamily enzyme YgiQ (UPF0313 family)|tara:strand:- start:199 stop:1632 length:1434 start_codon:yes stop_codon:yes gene_type:complete
MGRILFIQNLPTELSGIGILSAVLKKAGHETNVSILSFDKKEKLFKCIRDWKPDVAAFSIMSINYSWAVELAGELKRKFGLPNIFGGPHPTFYQSMIDDCPSVDCSCFGEGEEAFLEYMDCLEKGVPPLEIQNLSVRHEGEIYKNGFRRLIPDIDALPFFDREIYYKKYDFFKKLSTKKFITDRGCPYNCTYCFNHGMRQMVKGKGKYLRIQSPERAVEEIKFVIDRYPARMVGFNNDTFNWNKKWVYEFLDLYKRKINVPFYSSIRVDKFEREDAALFKKAGCHTVSLAVESGSERIRKDILNRNVSDAKLIASAGYLKEFGIKIIALNMVGLPSETLEESYQTVEINTRIKADYTKCSVFQPLPGTQAFEIAKKLGILKDDGKNLGSAHGKSLMAMENIKQMENLQKIFHIMVKFPKLFPLFKKLINYSSFSIVFRIIWAISQVIKFKYGYNFRFWEIVRIGLKSGDIYRIAKRI